MHQTIILRRSAVPGNKPSVSKLALGELAINTYDGKIYIHKSGSNGDSIEEVLIGNAYNTGSLTISGSQHLLIGNTTISGSLSVSGSYNSIIGNTQFFGMLQVGIFDVLPDPVPGGIIMSSSGDYYIYNL